VATLFVRMTGVGTPAYRWFDLMMSLRSSACHSSCHFLDDLVRDMWCRVMFTVGLRSLFVGLCLMCLLRVREKWILKQRVYGNCKDVGTWSRTQLEICLLSRSRGSSFAQANASTNSLSSAASGHSNFFVVQVTTRPLVRKLGLFDAHVPLSLTSR